MFKSIQLASLCLALVPAAFAEHPVLDSARRALDERIPEFALAQLKLALTEPDFPAADRDAAALLMAEAQLRAGKSAEALETLGKQGGKRALLLRAHALAGQRRWSEALAFYEELAGVSGVPLSATVGQAEALQMMGRTPEAVGVLEKLIAEGKAPVSAKLRHAGLLAELGRKTEAAERLRSIEPVSLSDSKWRDYVQARLLLAKEQWQAALDALDKIAVNLEGVSSNLNAAVVLAATEARLKLNAQGFSEARRALETFLWNNPDSPALEMVFRRLDQVNAQERSPREMELHTMAKKREEPAERRRAALAQFYVCRMQLRDKLGQRPVAESLKNFLDWFPGHELTTYVYEMKADAALQKRKFDAAIDSLKDAMETATDKERIAALEMRMGLASMEKADDSVAATYFRRAAEHSPRLRKNATFNAALAELGGRNFEGFRACLADFGAEHRADAMYGELLLESGLTEARDDMDTAPAALRSFLADYPAHPRRGEAHLVLAELQLEQGNISQAEAEIANARSSEKADESSGQAERNEYAAIFAADAETPRDERVVEKVKRLANTFIASHSKSTLLPEVRMKLGQVYFREQDFANAVSQFEILAKDHPDGPFAETALFLAAQCSARLIDSKYTDRALALFAQVVARKGPLKYHALFQQGLIQHDRDEDAGAIFQSILDAQPPAPVELRAAALCAKGDNLVRIAKGSPEKLGAAVSAYTQLAEMTDVGPEWHNKAVYKQCKALLQLGREQEALFFYSKLLDTASEGAKETFWLYKAGFEAAEMLKQQGNVRGALAVYEKLGKIPGARAEEARTIVKDLRLKHFIWN